MVHPSKRLHGFLLNSTKVARCVSSCPAVGPSLHSWVFEHHRVFMVLGSARPDFKGFCVSARDGESPAVPSRCACLVLVSGHRPPGVPFSFTFCKAVGVVFFFPTCLIGFVHQRSRRAYGPVGDDRRKVFKGEFDEFRCSALRDSPILLQTWQRVSFVEFTRVRSTWRSV